jgi:MerR family copper efflux transcriptional regulator
MIRHYESLGLMPTAGRTAAGYRQYSDNDVHALRFIARSRDLGFSIPEIGELLNLWQNRRRSSAQVKALAERHIADLDAKVRELLEMRATLAHLAHCCHGDSRPDCPILAELAGETLHAAHGPHDAHADHAAAPAPRKGQLRRAATPAMR